MSRLHWGFEFSHGFLNVFKRLQLREKMVSLSRERKVTLFLSLCIWLPALSFLCPSQTMNREFGGVSCRPAVVSLLESLSYKWRAWAGWEVMSYWWLISADGGKKMTPQWTGLVPKKEIHHFGKEINGEHPAALLAPGQRLALKPPDEAFRCVIVWLFISSVD